MHHEQEAPGWEARTAAIEGCLLLQNLRAPLANLIFCRKRHEAATTRACISGGDRVH